MRAVAGMLLMMLVAAPTAMAQARAEESLKPI